jgi:uncharacterized protein
MNKKQTSRYYEKALSLAEKNPEKEEDVYVLLSKAASAGDAQATYALATWYLHGKFLEKDIVKATAMLKTSARANVPDANFDLAVSYETGVGVARNERMAAKLYLRAALLGSLGAGESVGRCLYHGIGFVKDRVQARVWLDLFKEQRRVRGVGRNTIAPR